VGNPTFQTTTTFAVHVEIPPLGPIGSERSAILEAGSAWLKGPARWLIRQNRVICLGSSKNTYLAGQAALRAESSRAGPYNYGGPMRKGI